jgi:CRP-like cAMP-binding protein
MNNKEVSNLGDLSEHEDLIEQYLQENNKEAAVQLLVELIVKKARERNFDQAEGLRDKLFKVDSMAVNQIVMTGEVIEREKSNAVDKAHLNIWTALYDGLTTEETNALYYGMKLEKIPANHMIYKQGEMRSRLYFVDEGQLKMFYRMKDKAILLKTLGPGDIFGEDTFFFSDGFCTASVITGSHVKLRVLLKRDLGKLNKKAPGLESKLNDYCLNLESVADLLKAKNLERRIDKRFNLSGKVSVQMLDDKGKPAAKRFKAELLDISASGLAFLMKTTQKASDLLLGRNLNMKLTFDELASDLEINRVGTVVAVNREPFNEYVIHAEFLKSLDVGTMDDLEDLIQPEEV